MEVGFKPAATVGVAIGVSTPPAPTVYWDKLDFELPVVAGRSWFRALDTSQPSPDDIADPGKETPVPGSSYTVQGRSIVVLVNR